MAIPLYDGANAPDKKNERGNAGLWFERFFNQYDKNSWEIFIEDVKKKIPDGKSTFLKQFSGENNKGMCGSSEQLSAFVLRHNKMLASQQGISGFFENDWQWVSGMGNNHPVENGVLWHTVLGVPYLAGSAVKGLVRAWMELQEKPDFEKIHQWFGSDHKAPAKQQKDTQAGQVIFHDAIPYERVNLVLDVMTPHTGKWLSEGGLDNVPADWHDPIPIFFLSCKKIKLNFSIAKMAHADADLDLNEVWQALIYALDFIGSGAKTGTGYGFMSENIKINKQRKEEQEKILQEKEFALLPAEQKALVKLKEKLTKQTDYKGGAGCSFYQTLKSQIEESAYWSEQYKDELYQLAEDILNHLNIDIKKNKKAKIMLQTLKSRN